MTDLQTPSDPIEEQDTTNEPAADVDTAVSLLRLLVGASIEAPAELAERLKQWEAIAQETDTASDLADDMIPNNVRYALVGLLFETQDQVRGGVSRFGRLLNASSKLFLRSMQPITNSKTMQPVTNRYDQLVQRGESTVSRWIERGKIEEPHGRVMAREALGRTIDEVINQLAENPEIRDLVTQQSVGMAGELVDGVRSRTVTADTLLERVARGLLNRPPREQLPPPTPDVMAQGAKITTILNEEETVE